MTQKDAFEFLELPESASRSQVKIRLVEKLEDFTYLSKNASSDFLRRIHTKNIDKVLKIQDEFFPWSRLESGSEVVLPQADPGQAEIQEDEIAYTTPVIINAGNKEKLTPPENKDPAAWLITHMENIPVKAYPLKAGKNFIGRKAQPGLTPFIVLEDDPYISKIHAVIVIVETSEKDWSISDSAESNNGQPSKNGTYVNGGKDRVTGKIPLQEADTIQVGNTRLVFKSNDQDIAGLIAEVAKSTYLPAVSME